MFYVYVLWSHKLNKRYIGSTSNLYKRLHEHNKAKSPFTKSGIPWKLIYYESFPDKMSALKREKFLKSGRGRLFLDNLNSASVGSQPKADTPPA